MDITTYALCKKIAESSGSGLPPVTESDNGKIAIVAGGAWAADSNIFVVSVSGTSSKDKTFAEIVTAFNSGKTVYLNNGTDTYVLSSVSTAAVDFVQITNGGLPKTYRITNSEAIFSKEFSLLPKSNAADNGSEAIVKNGIWKMQQKKFIVTLTPTAQDFSGTMDKTVAEINSAYEAGQEIVFKVITDADTFVEVPCSAIVQVTGTGYYPNFIANVIQYESNVMIVAHTDEMTDGTKQTYSTTIYPLTPAM